MPIDRDDPRLTAYALGELDEAADFSAVEALVASDPEARQLVEEIRATAALLTEELAHEPSPGLEAPHRETIEARLGSNPPAPKITTVARYRTPWYAYAVAASLLIATGLLALRATWNLRLDNELVDMRTDGVAATPEASFKIEVAQADQPPLPPLLEPGFVLESRTAALADRQVARAEPSTAASATDALAAKSVPAPVTLGAEVAQPGLPDAYGVAPGMMGGTEMGTMGGAMGGVGGGMGMMAGRGVNPVGGTDFYQGMSGASGGMMGMSLVPGTAAPAPATDNRYAQTTRQRVREFQTLAPQGPEAAPLESRQAQPLDPRVPELLAQGQQGEGRSEAEETRSLAFSFDRANRDEVRRKLGEEVSSLETEALTRGEMLAEREAPPADAPEGMRFQAIQENPFLRVLDAPQSTFSIDVDTASYAIVRRFLLDQNLIPPPDAVRIEEMVNTFRYNYPGPGDTDMPVYADVEVVRCPWNADHRLARVALQARSIEPERRPPGNLVFLVDVSGSMNRPDKLPLLKAGLRMMVEQLQEGDYVGIVTYAGEAGVALESTPAERKGEILRAIDALQAGGSTNGSAGIHLAYDLAARHFDPDGTNRVVLATDGDFNVGVTDDDALVQLIAEKAKSKVYLTVLGFGSDNFQDARMGAVAQRGDGNYHYIDSEREARKVLVEELTGTLVTVARDVKIQLDFNPAQVEAYRLIGYESRLLEAQDFADDRKDAGEVGAGHSVTALYELVPVGTQTELAANDVAEQPRFVKPAEAADAEAPESFVARLRYKLPREEESRLHEFPVVDEGRDYSLASDDTRFAAAVASFGMLLRNSAYQGNATYDAVLELAGSALGDDADGQRAEFLTLVRKARELQGQAP